MLSYSRFAKRRISSDKKTCRAGNKKLLTCSMLQTKKKKKLNLWNAETSLSLFCSMHTNFWENKNASHRTRTFETLSDGKLHCFRNNTGIRINISSLSASTLIRECFFFSFCCFDIPKLKAIALFRSRVLASKVSSF